MVAKSKKKRTAMLEEGVRAAFCPTRFSEARISVVIPARDEALHLPRLLRALQAMPEIAEIIVSDGGSSDRTIALAREMGALVVEGARGRGAQQNAGARVSTRLSSGDVVWFLHADALPDEKCGRQIVRAVERGAIGGNFRLRFAARGGWPRFFELLARGQRARGAYYGDSGIWVERGTWEWLGGFQAWPLFEDLDFARRLETLARREGGKTACCAGRLRVSARRFRKSPWKVLLWWLGLQIGFNCGVSPHQLARFYHRRAK